MQKMIFIADLIARWAPHHTDNLKTKAQNTTGSNHLYNTLELLMMGIMVPETCWASNKSCNKNHLLHLVSILFPHMRPSVCALLLLQRSVCIPNSEWRHKLTVPSVTTRIVLGRSRYSVISFSIAASKSHYCFLMFYTFYSPPFLQLPKLTWNHQTSKFQAQLKFTTPHICKTGFTAERYACSNNTWSSSFRSENPTK